MPHAPSTALPHQSYRLDSIDALRGIAALMVVLYHVWGHYGIYPFPSIGVVPQEINPDLFSYLVSPMRWGYLGVSLFLVLSGFCIHLPFARKKKSSGDYSFIAREFYLRRIWRLYPAYLTSVIGAFFLLVIFSPFSSQLGHGIPSAGDLLTHLTFLHGYFDSYFYGIVHVYWSLALEFQLYLAYPIFLFLFRKVGLSRSIVLLVGLSIVWRYLSLEFWGFNLISVARGGPYSAMGSVLARMPEWLFGVWLAEWLVAGRNIRAKRLPLAMASTGVFFLAIVTTLYEPLWVSTDIVFGLSFALAVACCIVPNRKLRPSRRVYRGLIWFGTISYTVYLFHMPLSWLGNAFIQKLPGTNMPFLLRLVYFALSVPVLAYIYKFVEAPFLKAPRRGESYRRLYEHVRKLLGMETDTVLSVQLGSSLQTSILKDSAIQSEAKARVANI